MLREFRIIPATAEKFLFSWREVQEAGLSTAPLSAPHLTKPNLQLVYFYTIVPAGSPPSPCLWGVIKAAEMSAYTF